MSQLPPRPPSPRNRRPPSPLYPMHRSLDHSHSKDSYYPTSWNKDVERGRDYWEPRGSRADYDWRERDRDRLYDDRLNDHYSDDRYRGSARYRNHDRREHRNRSPSVYWPTDRRSPRSHDRARSRSRERDRYRSPTRYHTRRRSRSSSGSAPRRRHSPRPRSPPRRDSEMTSKQTAPTEDRVWRERSRSRDRHDKIQGSKQLRDPPEPTSAREQAVSSAVPQGSTTQSSSPERHRIISQEGAASTSNTLNTPIQNDDRSHTHSPPPKKGGDSHTLPPPSPVGAPKLLVSVPTGPRALQPPYTPNSTTSGSEKPHIAIGPATSKPSRDSKPPSEHVDSPKWQSPQEPKSQKFHAVIIPTRPRLELALAKEIEAQIDKTRKERLKEQARHAVIARELRRVMHEYDLAAIDLNAIALRRATAESQLEKLQEVTQLEF